MAVTEHLHVVYILPSRYDDEGYPRRYWRGLLPSNTLCCLRDITRGVAERRTLGQHVQVTVDILDENVQRIPAERLARRCRRQGKRLVVGLAGVQSNMFARASDLALRFRELGAQVLVGGFHVSGVLKLFHEPTRELRRLLDAGVTLVQGEVDGPGAMAGILRDALADRLRPIYRIEPPPALEHASLPVPDPAYQKRFMETMGTIDSSRGCPFNCSFCTIINVQGRKMRSRCAEQMLEHIERNCDRGFATYFFTDDNLSRSPVWEALFDGLAAIRARGKAIRFMMQVDTQAWRIPRFMEKAAAAGCYLVFVGMESVNPANLEAVGKKQNKVDQYADMVHAWHAAGILVHVGYIIGLPHDTPESVRRDVALLKDAMKVDEASFFMLTPLPGSRDHFDMVRNGTPLDADLNNYDSLHETFRHPNFKPGQWRQTYREAWQTFYNKENLVNILLRAPAKQYWNIFWLSIWNRYCTVHDSHPMFMGFFRRRKRRDRRPGYPLESRWSYARRRAADTVQLIRAVGRLFFEFQEVWLLSRRQDDPRWRTLAQLRARWTDVQERLREYDLGGRCDLACGELRDMAQSAAEQMRGLSASGVRLSRRTRAKLQRRAQEAENFVRALDVQIPNWNQVADAERYVRETLLSGYEEAVIRYVAQRRRLNVYRKELAGRLKSGRLLVRDFLAVPGVLLFELIIGLRFGWASLREL